MNNHLALLNLPGVCRLALSLTKGLTETLLYNGPDQLSQALGCDDGTKHSVPELRQLTDFDFTVGQCPVTDGNSAC